MKTLKMSHVGYGVVCAAALLCGAARAEEPVGGKIAEDEQIDLETEESSFVSGEFSLAFDSKYLSYGFVDNNDPIFTPDVSLTFWDTLTLGCSIIYDTTHYGRKAGYGNHRWRHNEIDPYVELAWSFSKEDYEWLPTTVDVALEYSYEYQPTSKDSGGWEQSDDTQYWTLTFGLPDLWLEPTFYVERDAMRSNGTYVNLELGHTFVLLGDDEDVDLSFRPSVAQGFGNAMRVRELAYRYLGEDEEGEELWEPLDHAGLMDTAVKGELTWNICDNLSLSGYVLYSDFVFDREIRHAARDYEASGDWDHSFNFVTGISLTASF